MNWERDLSAQTGVVDAMLRRIRHRGPDGSSTWISSEAVIGHVRLGIVDPENDRQPLVHDDGTRTCVIAVDGDVYDAQSVRDELAGKGHVFRTRTDAELLLRAYLEWGEQCVDHVDGIYGFAVWDKTAKKLFLARDRLGSKPLYWARCGSSVLFASEIKALLAHPEIEPVLSKEGLAEIVVAPATISATPGVTPFRDVREVRAARSLTFTSASDVRERVYWRLVSRPHTDDVDATVARVRSLLISAVERRLVADIPLAFTLSGGIDSTAVLAIGARALRAQKRDVPAWSVDFEEGDKYFAADLLMSSRDAPFAALAARELATKHQTVVLRTTEMVERFLEGMRARDLPWSTQRDVSLIMLCEKMRAEARLTLSGVGSDELFAGYDWMPVHDSTKRNFLWVTTITPEMHWPPWISKSVLAQVRPLEYLAGRFEEACAEVPRLPGEPEAAANDREDLYMVLTRRLTYMLDRRDRMAMVTGVDDRAPFADTQLIEYMWNVPGSMKRLDGFEKGLLRRALEGLVPDEIRSRKKSAFPAVQDPRYLRGLGDAVRAVLANPTDVTKELFDRDSALELLTRTDPNAGWRIENVLQLDAWVREYRIRLP